MLRWFRMIGSPHISQGRACGDSVSCSRCSFADGVSCPLRCTRRTSKPCRLRRLHNDRKVPWRAFFHKPSFPPRGAPPGNSRRRRRFRRALARSESRTRPPCARACAFSPSRAPCGGGSRENGLRTGFPPLVLWRIWRVRRPGLFLGRIRREFARVRENPDHISNKGPFPCAPPPSACGARVRMSVLLSDPCGAWFPHVSVKAFRRQWDGETACGLIAYSASGPRRGARPRVEARFRGGEAPCRR